MFNEIVLPKPKQWVESVRRKELYQHMLTIESYFLSLLALPFYLIMYVIFDVIFKYFNSKFILSLFRTIWLPLSIYSIIIGIDYLKDAPKNDGTSILIVLSIVILIFLGIVSWVLSYSESYNSDIRYIRSKGLWKWYK
jgi:hypothetical protein